MQIKQTLLASALLGLTLASPDVSEVLRLRSPTSPHMRRVTNEIAQSPAAVNSVNDNDGPTKSTSTFKCYHGNGSPSAGWPSQSSWISFDSMWNNLVTAGFGGCPGGEAPNSKTETSEVRSAIESIAAASKVDHRFILAIIQNESSGCVRVKTTNGGNGIDNPGLMQDHSGFFTCNCEGIDQYNQKCGIRNPCPSGDITGMVREGTQGTNAGAGLAGLINSAQSGGASGAQTFYIAATAYNTGSANTNSNLNLYAAKVANYLTGWNGNGGTGSC